MLDFLLSKILQLVASVVAFLPSWSLPSGVEDAFTRLFQLLRNFSFIPIDTVLTLLSLTVLFWFAVGVFSLGLWVIRLFRGN